MRRASTDFHQGAIMACCGGRRNPVKSASPAARPTQAASSRPPAPFRSPTAGTLREGETTFLYEGRSGLTAIGGSTGTRYRFDHPGATVVVDPRDRASLARVPGLRPVSAD